MKLIQKLNNRNEAHAFKGLLESKGIPAFVESTSGTETLGLNVSEGIGVWIYVDDQYSDAYALIENPEHEPKLSIDIEKFTKTNIENSSSLLNGKITKLALVLVVLVLIVIIVATI